MNRNKRDQIGPMGGFPSGGGQGSRGRPLDPAAPAGPARLRSDLAAGEKHPGGQERGDDAGDERAGDREGGAGDGDKV